MRNTLNFSQGLTIWAWPGLCRRGLSGIIHIVKSESFMGAVMTTKTSPKVLPKQAREVARKVQNDPERAAKFLVKAGIITKSGKLAANYR